MLNIVVVGAGKHSQTSHLPALSRYTSEHPGEGSRMLMEKPLGANLEEAEEICTLVERTGASVMISMNRRFDPALTAALNHPGASPNIMNYWGRIIVC